MVQEKNRKSRAGNTPTKIDEGKDKGGGSGTTISQPVAEFANVALGSVLRVG